MPQLHGVEEQLNDQRAIRKHTAQIHIAVISLFLLRLSFHSRQDKGFSERHFGALVQNRKLEMQTYISDGNRFYTCIKSISI
jgi:hypothetical protein